MKIYRTYLATIMLLFATPSTHGTLNLQLTDYENIPTDGSALIAIPDIGTHAEGRALICHHGITGVPPTSAIDDWLLVPENDEGESVSSDTGWSVSRGQNDGVVRLERITGISPLEGSYKCSVNKIDSNTVETVTVQLYWPLTDLVVSIEVLSTVQDSQSFRVSCVSTGGTVISSSFTGPNDAGLGALRLVEEQQQEQQGRGNNRYSQSIMRAGGSNGDVFTCTASTVASNVTVNNSLSVAGSVVDLTAVQVPSKSPALNISWTSPSTGAAATGYTVYYYSHSTTNEGVEESRSVSTDETTVLINQLLADGRTYHIAVEAHSIHLSGYSDSISYSPCIVSQLVVVSQTSTSLSLRWDRPSYFSGSLTGLVQYSTLTPDSDEMWVYVEESSDTLPALEGLEEFTNYSIQMAIVDTSHMLCVFSGPVTVSTGVGPVQSLTALAEDDGIELTWSPPKAAAAIALSYNVAYTPTRSGQSRTTVTTTQSLSWRIRATLGDMFSFSVTAVSDSAGSGEISVITAGVDYKYFQFRIDDIGKCSDWLGADSGTKQGSTTREVVGALSRQCNCDVSIRKSEFYCQMDDQDFVIFRAQLFAPPSITAEELLGELEDWVMSGPTITIAELRTVNSVCGVSESNAQSLPCAMSSDNVVTAALMNQSEENSISLGVLVGVAIGCFLIGALFTLVVLLGLYAMKRRYNFKRDSELQRQARSLAHSEHCEQNPRYVAAGDPPSQRQLPLLPLCVESNTVTFSNPVTVKDGACSGSTSSCTDRDCDHTYETAKVESPKVVNPLYQDIAEACTAELSKQKPTMSAYENIGALEKQPVDGEYVMMQSSTSATTPQYETAR